MPTANGHAPSFWGAADLAKVGYPVFPAKWKAPSVETAFYAATTDVTQVAAWITEGREHHDVAFATGIVSGVVVVEADTLEAYKIMEEKYGSPQVLTKRGGHWYFRHPKNGRVSSRSLGDGLDRKGDGGYVIAPPSTDKSWTEGIPDRSALRLLSREFRDEKAASTGEGWGTPRTMAAAPALPTWYSPTLAVLLCCLLQTLHRPRHVLRGEHGVDLPTRNSCGARSGEGG
jgi:hypothetical protein